MGFLSATCEQESIRLISVARLTLLFADLGDESLFGLLSHDELEVIAREM